MIFRLWWSEQGGGDLAGQRCSFLKKIFLGILNKNLFMHLFLAALGLHCCAQASQCGGSSRGTHAPGTWAQQLWYTHLVAPRHVKSSWTRDGTVSPCIGRSTLNHWTTREVQGSSVFKLLWY